MRKSIQKSLSSMEALLSQTMKTTMNYAFVSMNIKNFKGINLRFGSDFGDTILQEIQHILSQELCDREGFHHAYADVFELWVSYDDAHSLQERIYRLDDQIYQLSDNRIHQSIFLSFGIYNPQPHDTYQHMRVCADFCRSQSEDASKLNTHIEVYHDEMYTAYIRKQELALALRKGFAKKQFHIVLQPKISLKDKKIYGAEALLRWHDEKLKDVSTQEMILLSEQNGFVRELDFYIFEQVCMNLQSWYQSYHHYPYISVNVSRYHFENPLFFQHYLAIFQNYHIPPQYIEFEITETMMNHHSKTLYQVVEQMHHHGFRVALDDFGSGASSLAALMHMHISTLKLDRDFFINETAKSRILVKAILHMAKQLQVTTVCEGIESEEQESYLMQCGADMIQGYLYYPPLSIAQFQDLYYTTF